MSAPRCLLKKVPAMVSLCFGFKKIYSEDFIRRVSNIDEANFIENICLNLVIIRCWIVC